MVEPVDFFGRYPHLKGKEPPMGGSGDEMEARVRRLEDDFKEMKGDLKAIRLDLAEMKGRLNSMPTTWQMVGLIVAIALGMFTVIRIALPVS